MKKILLCLLLLAAPLSAPAQARTFSQPELDALLAPVALYPDSLLDQILVAATSPQQVAEAAQWSRANPHLSGDEAVRAVQPYGWHPSVAALAAFPDVLARMAESPQWLRELGEAWLNQEPYVMETVQQLRRRAQASGHLASDEQQHVYRQGETIVVQPVYQEVVYVRYYNPLVVFGPWWWPAYRPVYWRPWQLRPVRYHWVQQHHYRPVHRAAPVNRNPGHLQPRPSPAQNRAHRPSNGSASPAARMQVEQTAKFIERQRAARTTTATPYVRVQELQRQPIVNSAPQVRQMPAPGSFSQQRPAPRKEVQQQPRPAAQQQPRREAQQQPQREAQQQPRREAQQQRRDRRG